ncbi:YggS family pyridoxal phosphate-dependent enzyme [Alphaproteobacteria bacterium]|nr:YggS family pyridoxal phosphate-dependent enzyme [Alphaproteobacteria bacterium]
MSNEISKTHPVVASNLATIRDKIAAAEQTYKMQTGLDRPVTLVAVSKRQPDDRINAGLAAGQRVFGENRVQDARGRWVPRRAQYANLILHLIGPLQTNKVAEAVALFDVIEVVDRPKLAKALGNEMIRQNRQLECYVQVNTGKEAQKSGIAPEDADNFIAFCRDEAGLNITGLMCIPPVDEEAAMHFALLQTIAKRNDLSILSMGMSDDFEEAIAFGATAVRLGSAVFGARDS